MGNKNSNLNFKLSKIISINDNNINGIVFYNNYFYLSNGQNNNSYISKYNMNFNLEKRTNIDKTLHSKGLTIFNNQLITTTYNNKLIKFNLNLVELSRCKIKTQNNINFSLTNNEYYLIVSDGSEFLRFFNDNSYNEIKNIKIIKNNRHVSNIACIYYYNGNIYANIMNTNKIIVIEDFTGKIKDIYDFNNIHEISLSKSPITAFCIHNKYIYITGKYWNNIFKIKLM